MTKVDGQWKMSFYQVYLVCRLVLRLKNLYGGIELSWDQTDSLIQDTAAMQNAK